MKFIAFVFLAVFTFSACSPNEPTYDGKIDQLRVASITEAIELANGWRLSDPEITSFISPDKLTVVFPDGTNIERELPDDQMYIAIAPYINTTHTCATHYLSTCDAELKNKTFDMVISDENGSIMTHRKITSLNNGFFEIWLPRDRTFKLEVDYDNKSAVHDIETFSTSNTCITTMKLQ